MSINVRPLNQDNAFPISEKKISATHKQLLDSLQEIQRGKATLESLTSFSVKSGLLENIIYLHQNGHVQIPSSLAEALLQEAACYGQVEIIRYFHQQGIPFTNELINQLATLCSTYGSLNCLQYLHENGLIVLDETRIWELLTEAACHNNLNIIAYFHHNGVNLTSAQGQNVLCQAIINDHHEVIKSFQQGLPFTNEIVDQLATLCSTYGSLNCLQYLHENESLAFDEACIWKLLMEAARNNTLNIIAYLYENFYRRGAIYQNIYDYIICNVDDINICYFTEDENNQGDSFFIKENTEEKRYSQFLKYIFKQCTQEINKIKILKLLSQQNLKALKVILCVLYGDNIKDIDDILAATNKKDIESYYYLTISNGHIYIFHRLRKMFSFLVSDQRIGQEAFELALVNNRLDILSFFLNMNESFLRKKKVIKEFIRSAALFCEISTIDMLLTYWERLGINMNSRLMYYAAVNKKLDLMIYLNKIKGTSTQIFLRVNTENFPEDPVRQFLSDRRCLNELKGDLALIEKMQLEVKNDDDVFHPSHLWEFFNEVNITVLKESGFQNFKRTVNQNYFNFIPWFFKDYFFISILFLKLLKFTRSSSRYELTDPDVINSEGDIKESYRRVFEKHRNLKLFLYKFTVGGLWDYVKNLDTDGLLQKLEEPRVGNPIEIKNDQKLISQDLANSVQEYYFIRPYIKKVEQSPPKIVEIGAGYGRLGHVLLSALNCKYIVFDIAPALYISQKYLSEVFPDKKIFSFRHVDSFDAIKEELEQSDIAFFTINQIKLFPENYCDFCVNISSLHEMAITQREKISEYMAKITKDYIYIKQYKKYKNPFDKIIVREKDYNFPAPWQRVLRRTTPTNIRFFEMIFQKNSCSS